LRWNWHRKIWMIHLEDFAVGNIELHWRKEESLINIPFPQQVNNFLKSFLFFYAASKLLFQLGSS
jgi:hypothetical protein